MIGWILAGLAAAATVSAIVIVIRGVITKNRIREKMREEGIRRMIVQKVDECSNIVKLEDLNSDKTIEIQGDGISSEIDEYDTIVI